MKLEERSAWRVIVAMLCLDAVNFRLERDKLDHANLLLPATEQRGGFEHRLQAAVSTSGSDGTSNAGVEHVGQAEKIRERAPAITSGYHGNFHYRQPHSQKTTSSGAPYRGESNDGGGGADQCCGWTWRQSDTSTSGRRRRYKGH